MTVEQGLSFTVIEAPHPLEDDSPGAVESYKAERDFYSARRIWLGWVPGTDWLHDEIERQFGEDNVWYVVRSERDASHVGAAGEIATVILILMGAGALEFARKFGGKLGDRSAGDIYEWVKGLARERRKERGIDWEEPAPNFREGWELGYLAEAMKAELADIMRLPETELEITAVERRDDLALFATYRLKATGTEYTAEVADDFVDFRRVGAQSPQAKVAKRRFWRR